MPDNPLSKALETVGSMDYNALDTIISGR